MSKQIIQSSKYKDSLGKLAATPNASIKTIDISHREQPKQNYRELIEAQQLQIKLLRNEVERLKNGGVAQSKFSSRFWHLISQYFAKIDFSSHCQPRFTLNQVLFSYIGSFLGIATLAYLSVGSGYPLIAAPFGAAAVLVFAVPDAALAQPRNLIFGNLLGAVISVVMVSIFGSEPWVMALAVATAIKCRSEFYFYNRLVGFDSFAFLYAYI